MPLYASVRICLLFALFQAVPASAAEIELWTARALATVLDEIGPEFERATGHTIKVSIDLPAPFVKRARAGESFDVMISVASPIDELAAEGLFLHGTRADIARSGIGVRVRAGAHKPDISSTAAFKQALLEAKSIAYLRIGSGAYMADLVERLDIAAAIAPKVTRPQTDIVSEMVARGEVELGIVVITQILTTPGVELVGPLPQEVQSYVTFAGAVAAKSKAPEAGKQLLQFLATPKALAVMRSQGMEPVPTKS